jgi:hypothetical protein
MIRLSLIGVILNLPVALFAQTQDSNVVWAEASVSYTNPYVQQTIVYTVVVKSTEPLTKVPGELDIPDIRGVTRLQKGIYKDLSNPYQIEYRYALTPLSLRQLRIPSIQIEVTYVNQWRYSYKKKIQTQELILNVQPPATPQKLWLPLKDLKLQGYVDKTSVTNVGDPITVTLTLDAVGMSGDRLPILTLPVDEKNFHVYAETSPKTNPRISPDKTTIIGQRIEKYTLVPQRVGKLEIPVVRLFWWDIKKNHESMVEWLGPVVQVGDVMPIVSKPSTEETVSSEKETNNWLLNIGGIGVILFIIGWWLGAGRPGKSQIKYLLGTISIAMRRQARYLWMNLRVWLHQLFQVRKKQSLTEMDDSVTIAEKPSKTYYIPKPVRIFNLLHAIDTANNPVVFLQYVQQLAHEFLHLPPFTALPQIAEALLITYPYLDTAKVHQLFQTLDDALYSGTYTFNPEAWKAEFKQLFRTLPFHSAQLPAQEKEKLGLPPLNPFVF